MKIQDKAETPTEDIDLARYSAARAYKLLTDELVPADELTPDGEFPQYGDFLHVGTETGTQWIECPRSLAAWIVDADLSVGDGFRIRTVSKVDGEWEYKCERLMPGDVDRLANE
jgi:hypothetical protein